ncbi:MAG: TldD/PmbA family protein [Pseudomonadota bacterium]
MKQQLETFLAQHHEKADSISITHISDETQYYQARGGKADPYSAGATEGLYLEIQTNGVKVYGSTPSLQQLPALFETLKARAKGLKPYQLIDFTHQIPSNENGHYESYSSVSTLSPRTIQDTLCEYSQNLLNNGLYASEASCIQIHRKSLSLNTNGASISQTINASALYLSATAEKNGEMQTRSNGFKCLQAPLEHHFKEADDACLRIRAQALELIHADNCPNATLDLVLAPDQLYLQVHESIGHPLELDRILGDERNYAGFSFINLEDIGTLTYGSPLLNVTFDPSMSSEMASYGFDATGLKAETRHIIKDGQLVRALGGGDSQYRCDVPGVACARQTAWNRAPIDRMANLNIEPGSSPFDEIITSIENGIYMETNRSWSIDDYRRKFQFGAEYARLIKNGKLGAVVKNPNYRGTTLPFWHSLSHVGNIDTNQPWGSLYCGKGEPNQVVRVGHAVPVCAFRGVDVFGGAA